MFRRSGKAPRARQGGPGKGGGVDPAAALPGLPDLADLTDPEAVDAVLRELDELRATVYRQATMLREGDSRFAGACAMARAQEHRRVQVAVAAMGALARADPDAPPEVAAFAARIEAAVDRLSPVS